MPQESDHEEERCTTDVDPIEDSICTTSGQIFRFFGIAGEDICHARQQMLWSSRLPTQRKKLTRIQHRGAGKPPPSNSPQIILSDGFDERERRLATGTYKKQQLQNWRQSFLGTLQLTDKRDIPTVNVNEPVMEPIEESSPCTQLNQRRKSRRGKALPTRFRSLKIAKGAARKFAESSVITIHKAKNRT